MFTVEQLEKKVAELAQQVEQSAANHHVLLGSKMTYEGLLLEARKAAATVATVANEVEKAIDVIEPVVEASTSAQVN